MTDKKIYRVKNVFLLIVGILLFLCIAVGFTMWFNRVCIPYTAKADKVYKTLYSSDVDMDEVDICFIGGSHGINAFNPNVLWREYGLHSYNFCYAGETVALSDVYLEELYEKRSFELVVLDIYYLGIDDTYFGESDYAFDVLNKMKYDDAKKDYIDKHVSDEHRLDYLFPLTRYHTRWMDITKEDIERKPDIADDYKLGQDYHYEVNDGTIVKFRESTDKGQVCELSDGVEDDLVRFIEIALAHGSKVLLADIPRRYNDSLAPAKWLSDEYACVNKAKQIADKYDVDILRFSDDELKEIGFEPEKCMYNKGHLNIVGSEVYSSALGRYIVDNYDVTRYERQGSDIWEGYLRQYEAERKKHIDI